VRFYNVTHKHYCGIDLHGRNMYTYVLDQEGKVLLHRDLPTVPDVFLKAIAPFRESLVVAVECIFTWYWLADLCAREGIDFVLGHALYMKAIHGGEERPHRCFQDRNPAPRRNDSSGLRTPARDALHSRSSPSWK